MERLTFDPSSAFAPRDALLDGVTVAPLTRSLRAGSTVQAAIFRLEPGGRIARHPASVPQILAVLDGQARVSGADGRFASVSSGQAVYWAAGEDHETRTDSGLTALLIEADGLLPYERAMAG